MNYLKEILASRELLINLTMREVKGKYKRTVFGQLWSLANPLALMLIYTFVFSFIFRVKLEPGDPSGLDVFAIWLLCGLLPWIFFANVLNNGITSLVSNAGLIQKVAFSRVVLPLSQVASAAYNWMFEIAVLVVVLSILGAFVLPWIPLVIVAMVLLAVFAAGLALMLAIANVYFRDTQWFLSIVLQLWMYLSPVIYPVSLVEDASKGVGGIWGTSITILDLYHLNPMVYFLELFRNLLYDNRWPDPMTWLICLAWAVGAFVVGLWVFRRNEKNLAEAL
ncbi:ABC transporter permease [Salinibacterium sp. dk2585]|uniref:ABC transporter permease n=1 Tax=unclassified Salinibacterium TaxID=2632331 RepID=UPI0011C250FD|nr:MULTISPECIES: ABC transporter permease [unclassified Salinibacterium]QEE60829.1 ABC transporter permease [Salinibacterium sp. dk2585]TXK55901.1 ABC transporter permease [Salinibacterium sp. dk5596]